MKKYRLGYDKCFLACNAEGKELELNGEKIIAEMADQEHGMIIDSYFQD